MIKLHPQTKAAGRKLIDFLLWSDCGFDVVCQAGVVEIRGEWTYETACKLIREAGLSPSADFDIFTT
jgi:hypothetical protein